MAFQQSPGVVVNEIDLTTIVPGASASIGALAGVFRWGPVGVRTLVDSEATLRSRFAAPTNFNAETWFSGANFLAYTNALEVVRAAQLTGNTPILTTSITAGNSTVTTASTTNLLSGMVVIATSNASAIRVGTSIQVVNSTAFTISANTDAFGTDSGATLQFAPNTMALSAMANTGSVSNLAMQTVATYDAFPNKFANADFSANILSLAKWPGAVGNSLRISICDSANAFASNTDLTNGGIFTGTLNSTINSNNLSITIGPNTTSGTFSVNTFNTFITSVGGILTIGDYITAGNTSVGTQNIKITSIGNTVQATIGANSGITAALTSASNTVTTTAGAFSGVTAGQWLAFYSNTTVYRTAYVSSVTDANTIVLGAIAGFTNATSSWATVSANGSIALTTDTVFKKSQNTASTTLSRLWEFRDAFSTAPGQSTWVRYNGNTSANDEVHVIVTDNLGKFTGAPGTVLEKYSGLSRASDAKNENNDSNFYRDVINTQSPYVWMITDRSGSSSNSSANVASSTTSSPLSLTYNYGQNGADESTIDIGTLTTAWDMFQSAEDSDISLIIQGKARGGSNGGQLANYLIDNIAEPRQDCVVFISPNYSDVVNAAGREADNVVLFRNSLRSTSYGFMDSGYKYQYDSYNDVYRYIPLNGDIAGLAARTDATNDAWWSFAGLNRGKIKNIVRLSWNPRQAYRDQLYKNGVNPVVTFQGDGTVLYGDKTLLAKPSAFDRINVRRLFIALEKSISRASKYTLFEFNDAFTRAQWRNLIIPFLRDIQGRRGISDFQVVCDGTNNTSFVIDSNGFVGDIFIKAARSINYIQLNFINTPTGLSFSEVSGVTRP